MIEEILTTGRLPFGADVLDGGLLLIETSEELLPARSVGRIVRGLGERGILGAVDAVLVARPPVSDFTRDMTKIGHFGTGDLEVAIGNRSDFERVEPLIAASYQTG